MSLASYQLLYPAIKWSCRTTYRGLGATLSRISPLRAIGPFFMPTDNIKKTKPAEAGHVHS